jgi:hypothetical protein
MIKTHEKHGQRQREREAETKAYAGENKIPVPANTFKLDSTRKCKIFRNVFRMASY